MKVAISMVYLRYIGSISILCLVVAVLAVPASAQELNCRVNINTTSLSGSEYRHLDNLPRVIEEYMNQRRWTDDRFQEIERIDCNMEIAFTHAEGLDRFRARLTVGSRRPIYGTTQYTHVFQLIDNEWQFQYVEGQSLVFDLNRYDSFTSVLDYYAYVILGFDYDTFSELGGTPHFERARRIAELASSAGAPGWGLSAGDRSRMSVITQILDARLQSLREAYFTYHFEGLDHFITQTDGAREVVFETLQSLRELHDRVARRYVMDMFFSTKYQELVAVFMESTDRQAAYNILMQLDPSHSSAYDRLLN